MICQATKQERVQGISSEHSPVSWVTHTIFAPWTNFHRLNALLTPCMLHRRLACFSNLAFTLLLYVSGDMHHMNRELEALCPAGPASVHFSPLLLLALNTELWELSTILPLSYPSLTDPCIPIPPVRDSNHSTDIQPKASSHCQGSATQPCPSASVLSIWQTPSPITLHASWLSLQAYSIQP